MGARIKRQEVFFLQQEDSTNLES
ncbi:uncharacterized protein METZ01_LOCUS427498 [marine metagenome]|uniref:Uncharacterized protein n=1 Tax=marine metagenome TaxID=408172 RepID=A0A382XUT8_9ZZZZ